MNGTMKINAQGHLEIGGVDAIHLAEKYGTPLYVLDEEHIRFRAAAYKESLNGLPNSEVIYAGKAFLTTGMAALVQQLGLSLDVVSGGELFTALKAGFDPANIYFHGNNKSEQELDYALRSNVGRIVVDSLYELELLDSLAKRQNRQASIYLRITPGVDAHTHSYIQTGQLDSKFGLAIATGAALKTVFRAQELEHVHLVGLHCHIGSQIFDTAAFGRTIELMLDFMADLAGCGVSLEELDLGGGLGIRHSDDDEPMSVPEFGRFLVKTLQEAAVTRSLPVPKLLIEPGRSLIGEAGTTLYTVGTIKELPGIRTYASIDGGMGDNPRVALYQAKYEGYAANKMTASADSVYTVAGKYCESGDRLLIDAQLPHLEAGDILAVPATGAYNYSMSSNYNMLPRPAIVAVYRGESTLVVERERYEDLVRHHQIPERWRGAN